MKVWKLMVATALTIAAPALFATAEDLGGTTEFLCSTSWTISCAADKICETGLPTEWNIPQFVIANLDRKTLSTTKAHGESRTTPIDLVRSENGLIFILGHELDRTFSVVVSESSGSMSGSITMESSTISVFGACTPLPIEEVAQ